MLAGCNTASCSPPLLAAAALQAVLIHTLRLSLFLRTAVFGREDKWTGLGIFFDTFQNVDHSHHHKHPYIYVMQNDGTKSYIPDAETTGDSSKQVRKRGRRERGGRRLRGRRQCVARGRRQLCTWTRLHSALPMALFLLLIGLVCPLHTHRHVR